MTAALVMQMQGLGEMDGMAGMGMGMGILFILIQLLVVIVLVLLTVYLLKKIRQ